MGGGVLKTVAVPVDGCNYVGPRAETLWLSRITCDLNNRTQLKTHGGGGFVSGGLMWLL